MPLSSFPVMSPNPGEEISLIHIHMQIVHPEDKKKERYYFKRKTGWKEAEREVQLITTEQMFQLCVGSSVSSLSPSGVKLRRWPV